MSSNSPWLHRLPDGTVKQRNPFTGTSVWTMPGRGRRPLPRLHDDPVVLPPGSEGVDGCAFCPGHGLDNPPEKARLVRDGATGDGGAWRTVTGVPAGRLDVTAPGERAEFRRIPNLFEICSASYWYANHGVRPGPDVVARCDDYLADPAGRAHVEQVAALRSRVGGTPPPSGDDELRDAALGWFASTHELVIPRRHHVDGATTSDQLAGSGQLLVDEHRAYVSMAVDAMADLYSTSEAISYVSVFQNWLKPAGASFEHLHKQVVAIDETGDHVQAAARVLERNPDAFNEMGLDVAVDQGLLVAANDRAVAFAGFGHRYPSIEVYSLSPRREPWLADAAEVGAMADLLHAVHAAGGAQLPCNEEWHHRPPGMDLAMPWRVVVKWRISTLAGFEGATKVYLNTLSPWDVRDRVVGRLHELRAAGLLADGLAIGDECRVRPGSVPTA